MFEPRAKRINVSFCRSVLSKADLNQNLGVYLCFQTGIHHKQTGLEIKAQLRKKNVERVIRFDLYPKVKLSWSH